MSSLSHGRDSEEMARAGDQEETILGHETGQQHDRSTSDMSMKM